MIIDLLKVGVVNLECLFPLDHDIGVLIFNTHYFLALVQHIYLFDNLFGFEIVNGDFRATGGD